MQILPHFYSTSLRITNEQYQNNVKSPFIKDILAQTISFTQKSYVTREYNYILNKLSYSSAVNLLFCSSAMCFFSK